MRVVTSEEFAQDMSHALGEFSDQIQCAIGEDAWSDAHAILEALKRGDLKIVGDIGAAIEKYS